MVSEVSRCWSTIDVQFVCRQQTITEGHAALPFIRGGSSPTLSALALTSVAKGVGQQANAIHRARACQQDCLECNRTTVGKCNRTPLHSHAPWEHTAQGSCWSRRGM
eukprot:scaffold154624_cov33-Tisochrysis_lutea.AAC.2